jgi:NAD-dependent dihydropyrimidine dehydrogenase PreA subunit
MILVDENACVGCAMCVPACPDEAISCCGKASIGENCTECLTCLEFCPVCALGEDKTQVG